MNFLKHRSILLCLIGLLSASAFCSPASAKTQPNIMIILADDMGYGDLRCMGSQYLVTPHLDALAESGVLCTQGYVASSVCSPSRAGLLTGRDPRRFGYEGNLNQGASSYATRPELLGLPPGEFTLGDHLRSAGYATALIGKWHQGMSDEFHPNSRGFDFFCGMLGGSHNYFPQAGKHQIQRNGEPVTEFSNNYLTDFFTDEGLRFIKRQTVEEPNKPWFIFFSYNAPHGPLQATDADLEKFKHIPNRKRQTYAAMMFALDRGVGRIRDHLRESGQLENTLVVFLSDNGGATGNASWNGPLSGVKGTLREGGVRVPTIYSWPSVLPAGKTHKAPVSSLDLLPTFVAAANAKPLPLATSRSHEDAKNRKRMVARFGEYDGINLLPVLRGDTDPQQRTLFWRLQGQVAVLDGNEKLIRLSHRPAQVFRPASDQGEQLDLITQESTRAAELFRQLGEWESLLPTVPLWGSSPYWTGESANQYDSYGVREEPYE